MGIDGRTSDDGRNHRGAWAAASAGAVRAPCGNRTARMRRDQGRHARPQEPADPGAGSARALSTWFAGRCARRGEHARAGHADGRGGGAQLVSDDEARRAPCAGAAVTVGDDPPRSVLVRTMPCAATVEASCRHAVRSLRQHFCEPDEYRPSLRVLIKRRRRSAPAAWQFPAAGCSRPYGCFRSRNSASRAIAARAALRAGTPPRRHRRATSALP